jgi:hypothetical protein
MLPKSAFLVSSLNSIYWIWYVVDFVPALNASPIENFHVDPIYGFGGLGLSILIQSAFTLYPLSLVSKIAYRAPPTANHFGSNSSDDRLTKKQKKKNNTALQKQQEILVWKHTLPLLQTSSKPLIFPVGGITMDKTSETTRTILEDLGGNIGKFEGHLGLKKVPNKNVKNDDGSSSSSFVAKFPLVVDIRNPSEVYDSELMLHSLLSRRIKQYNDKGTERIRSADQSEKDRNRFHQQKSKYQKKKRHRGKR